MCNDSEQHFGSFSSSVPLKILPLVSWSGSLQTPTNAPSALPILKFQAKPSETSWWHTKYKTSVAPTENLWTSRLAEALMIGWWLEWLARVTLGLRGDHFQMAPVLPMWRWDPVVLRFENLWPYTTNHSLLNSWILQMSQQNNPCFETFTTASLKQTLQVELVPISSGHLCGLCGLWVSGTKICFLAQWEPSSLLWTCFEYLYWR